MDCLSSFKTSPCSQLPFNEVRISKDLFDKHGLVPYTKGLVTGGTSNISACFYVLCERLLGPRDMLIPAWFAAALRTEEVTLESKGTVAVAATVAVDVDCHTPSSSGTVWRSFLRSLRNQLVGYIFARDALRLID